MVFTLFFPIIPFIMQVIVCAYWGASALYLASMGSNNFASANVTVNGTQTIVEKALEEIPCDPNVSQLFLFAFTCTNYDIGM